MEKPEDMTNEQLADFIKIVCSEAALILGQVGQGSESGASMMEKEKRGWEAVSIIKQRLEGVVLDGKDTTEQLVSLNGSQGSLIQESEVLHPMAVFQKYKNATDIDTAKYGLRQTARVAFSAMAVELQKCYTEPIEKLITELSSCNLSSVNQEGKYPLPSGDTKSVNYKNFPAEK